MAEIGRDHGLDTLIAPVRPNLKHRYPLVPMERYITWRRPDGTHLDPWLRTHERVGAPIVKVAPESMRVPVTVAEWEEWAAMAFPETGSYVVPGALAPVVYSWHAARHASPEGRPAFGAAAPGFRRRPASPVAPPDND